MNDNTKNIKNKYAFLMCVLLKPDMGLGTITAFISIAVNMLNNEYIKIVNQLSDIK